MALRLGCNGTSISAHGAVCASCIPWGVCPLLWDSWWLFIPVNSLGSAKIQCWGLHGAKKGQGKTLRWRGTERDGLGLAWGHWGQRWQWDSYGSCAICCTRGEAPAKKESFGLVVSKNNQQSCPSPFSFPSLSASG